MLLNEDKSPCLLLSAVTTTLLLLAHIVIPDRTLSVLTNIICLLICICSAAVCCLPSRIWSISAVRMLCTKFASFWLALANFAICALCFTAVAYALNSSSSATIIFDNPLSRLLSQISGLTYRALCWQSVVLLGLSWLISSLNLIIWYRYGVAKRAQALRFSSIETKRLLEEDERTFTAEECLRYTDYCHAGSGNEEDDRVLVFGREIVWCCQWARDIQLSLLQTFEEHIQRHEEHIQRHSEIHASSSSWSITHSLLRHPSQPCQREHVTKLSRFFNMRGEHPVDNGSAYVFMMAGWLTEEDRTSLDHYRHAVFWSCINDISIGRRRCRKFGAAASPRQGEGGHQYLSVGAGCY